MDIRTQKHGQSLTNMQIQNALVASGMKLLFQNHSKEELEGLKKAAKFDIIKSHCDKFRGIFKDFIEGDEDRENILHQFACFFGEHPSIENCFDTVVQYFWT